MPEEILDITPSGGLYCLIPNTRRVFDLSHPCGYAFDDIAGPAPGAGTDCAILHWGMRMLGRTALGQGLQRALKGAGWKFLLLKDDSSARIGLDSASRVVSVPCHDYAGFFRTPAASAIFLCQLAKALRLAWHFDAGNLSRHTLSPGSFLLYRRVVEADADVFAIATGFQLRGKNEPAMWRSLLSSDLHGLASAFQDCLDFDESADGLPDAIGSVFSDWFLGSERIAQTDHESLNLLDARGVQGIETELRSQDIVRLTMLPGGFSYLECQASEILDDAFYGAVEDGLNRRHLTQIVTERNAGVINGIVFRDADLARRIFPGANFEIVA